MTDLEPCLLGCDTALAEAELLIAMLSASPDSFDPALSAVQEQIAALRHEVERLRGMAALPVRRKIRPYSIDLTSDGSPWAVPGGDNLDGGQIRSV